MQRVNLSELHEALLALGTDGEADAEEAGQCAAGLISEAAGEVQEALEEGEDSGERAWR